MCLLFIIITNSYPKIATISTIIAKWTLRIIDLLQSFQEGALNMHDPLIIYG